MLFLQKCRLRSRHISVRACLLFRSAVNHPTVLQWVAGYFVEELEVFEEVLVQRTARLDLYRVQARTVLDEQVNFITGVVAPEIAQGADAPVFYKSGMVCRICKDFRTRPTSGNKVQFKNGF